MAFIQSSEVNIGLARESTRGVPEATPDFWIYTNSLTVEDMTDYVNDDAARGRRSRVSDRSVTREWAEGQFTFNIDVGSIGAVLTGIMGTVTTAANTPVAGVRRHTFTTLNAAMLPSFTLFVAEDNGDRRHAECVFSELEITSNNSGHATATVSFMAQKSVTATITPAIPDVTLFLPPHVEFNIASN